jgi:SAM-dependent methyltransferase
MAQPDEASWPDRLTEPADRRRQEPEWLLAELARGKAKGRRVLDVDCGPGYVAWRCAVGGAAQVIGVSSSPGTLAWAQRHFAGGAVRFREGVGHSLPLASGDVDLAVSLETLEEQRDAPAFVAELHRVLSAGGLLVLSTRLTRGERRLHPPDPLHVREYDDVELAQLLQPRFSIAERLGLFRPAGSLRARPQGVRVSIDRAVGPVVTRLLGGRLAQRLAGPSPQARGRLSADGWEAAPVQVVVARKVG